MNSFTLITSLLGHLQKNVDQDKQNEKEIAPIHAIK